MLVISQRAALEEIPFMKRTTDLQIFLSSDRKYTIESYMNRLTYPVKDSEQ